MGQRGSRKAYKVTFERDGDGWWVAEVTGLKGCHTQGRSIGQARERIREAMALFDVPEGAELVEEIRLDSKLDAELRSLREKRDAAERLARESSEATKRVADRLAKAGLSRRDVGELLGVSFQRVQQIAQKPW
jgi:predicted RNase H-like HicB family nuclease